MSRLKLSILLVACVVEANVLPRQTSFANDTITASSSSIDPTSTPSTTDAATLTTARPTASENECANVKGECYVCYGIADGISLNSWWTSSYDLTVATVSVNYIQYDNTVIAANSSTYLVPNATTIYGTREASGNVQIPGIPTDIVDGRAAAWKYGKSVIAPATAQNLFNQTTIQSPSAWVHGLQVLTVGWTEYSDGVSVTNGITPGVHLGLSSVVISVASETAPIYSGNVRAPLPSAWSKIISDNLSTIPGTNKSLSYCKGNNWDMSGEPTAHIPVNELTVFARNTITRDGVHDISPEPTTSAAEDKESDKDSSLPVENEKTRTQLPETREPSPTSDSDQSTTLTTDTAVKPETTPTTSRGNSGPAPTKNEGTENDSIYTPTDPIIDPEPTNVEGNNDADDHKDDSGQDRHGTISEATALPIAIPTAGRQTEQEKTSEGESPDTQGNAVSHSNDTPTAPGNEEQPAASAGNEQALEQGSTIEPSGAPSGGDAPAQGSDMSNESANERPLPSPSSSVGQIPAPFVVLGTSTFTQNSASAFVIDGNTLSADGPAVTNGNDVVSLASSGVVRINGGSSRVVTPVGVPVTIEHDAAATPIAGGAFLLPNNVVLPEGATSVIGENTFVAGPSGILSVDGEAANPAVSAVPAIVPGAAPQSAPGLVIEGSTVLPGGSAVVLGTTYALPTMGNGILINGQETSLPAANSMSLYNLDGIVATPTEIAQYIFPETSLLPGSAVTVDGVTYSIAPTGNGLVVNDVTITAPAAYLQVGSSSMEVAPTQISGSDAYMIDDQTLTSGGKITVSDLVLSIAPSGGAVVAVSGEESHTVNIGDEIMSGIGGGDRVSSPTQGDSNQPTTEATAGDDAGDAVEESTGGAERLLVGCGAGVVGLLMVAFWL